MSDVKVSELLSLPVLNDDHRDLDAKVGTAIFRVHNRLERRMIELLDAHGLTLPQFDVLMTLWQGDGINQQELAERLLVTKGNVVGIIDRASASGWLERRCDPRDRRANRLYLTQAGRNLIAHVLPSQVWSWRQIFGEFTSGELQLMHELFIRLERVLTNPS